MKELWTFDRTLVGLITATDASGACYFASGGSVGLHPFWTVSGAVPGTSGTVLELDFMRLVRPTEVRLTRPSRLHASGAVESVLTASLLGAVLNGIGHVRR
jgi:hypothetical protein